MFSRAIGFAKHGMPTLWHGTRPKVIPKILKEGLRAAYEGTGFNSTFLPKGQSLSDVSIAAMKALPKELRKQHAKEIAKGIAQMKKWKPGVSLSKDRRHARIYGPTLKVQIPDGHPKLKQWAGMEIGRGEVDEWRFDGDIPPEWISRD